MQGLSDLLIYVVEGGASVGFMLPLPRARAEAYWRAVCESAALGERVLLVAEDAQGAITGTVQVLLNQPENQPHRGNIAKMQVHRRARHRGLGLILQVDPGSSGCLDGGSVTDGLSCSGLRIHPIDRGYRA